jgi:hypothetical protein
MARTMDMRLVTLTYDTTHVPLSDRGYMSLSKRDCQLFFKRLRKAMPLLRFKYIVAGEYGSKTHRPHYHVVLFCSGKFSLPLQRAIEKAWGLGSVHIGEDSSPKAVAYALKYIMKDEPFDSAWRHCVAQFRCMSKHIGYEYVSAATIEYHNRCIPSGYCINFGGDIYGVPRYYREKIFAEDSRAYFASIFSQLAFSRDAPFVSVAARYDSHVHSLSLSHVRGLDTSVL